MASKPGAHMLETRVSKGRGACEVASTVGTLGPPMPELQIRTSMAGREWSVLIVLTAWVRASLEVTSHTIGCIDLVGTDEAVVCRDSNRRPRTKTCEAPFRARARAIMAPSPEATGQIGW